MNRNQYDNVRAEYFLIFSAFLHSAWNFIFKRLEPKNSVLLLIVLIATAFSILVSPFTGGLKLGSILGLACTIVAGLFEAGYFHSLSKTYESAPFGISYSIMRGGAMLMVSFVSILFLNEPISSYKLIGIVILMGGIFLAPSKDTNSIQKQGFMWAISCAFFIAGYHLFYGFALKEGVSQVGLFILSMLTSIPFLAFKSKAAAIKNCKKIEVRNYLWITVAGIVSAGSFILFLYGLKESHPGVAISMRNTSIIFSQGFAWSLGEKPTNRQWLGISGIFTGATLVAW